MFHKDDENSERISLHTNTQEIGEKCAQIV